MAYGEGRSRLYAEIGKEEGFELGRYERELAAAEAAAKKESEGSSLWSLAGNIVGLILGSPGGPEGMYKGWLAGGEGGKWLHRGLSGYDPEDYAVTTDPGKFDVGRRYILEDVNRQFQKAADAQFWADVVGTGRTAFSMFFDAPDLGGEKKKNPISVGETFIDV